MSEPNGNGQDMGLLAALNDLRDADTLYFTRLSELNDSGASGRVFIGVKDGEATVLTVARGLEKDSHPMHVHGFGGFPDAETPTEAVDDDNDGFIELAEGAQTYGPVQVDISLGVTGRQVIDIQTFTFDDDTANGDLTPDNLDRHEIVLHGLTLKEGEGANGGEADGTAGYKEILPIAAGELVNLTLLADLANDLANADIFYAARLNELNDSGASGGLLIAVDDGEASVFAFGEGVEAGQNHLMHIHGFGGTPDAMTPTEAADTDGDGFIELAEGAQVYGPIQVDISPGVTAEDFVHFDRFDFNDDPSNGNLTAANLDDHEIVLHGLTLEAGQGANGGEADGTAGYKEVLPIAAGELVEVPADQALAFAGSLLALEFGDVLGFG